MPNSAVPAPIPFALPFTGPEEEEAVLRVLRSGWLTTGAEALAFEKEAAAFLDTGESEAPLRCLAVNSATSGLHLALEALGIGPGGLVFVPSYTFTATAEVVRYVGAEVVFVDCEKDAYNISAASLEAALERTAKLSGKPAAVIPVHFGGLPCEIKSITDLARRRGLAVVEDAAHAFSGRYAGSSEGGWAGTAGDAGVFSFYATKTISTGEGGMVITRNSTLAERISIMRSHGIDRTVWNRYTDTGASWYYEVCAPGFKYNMPDLLAAMGRVQLGRALKLLEMRRAIAAVYDGAFAAEPELVIPPNIPGDARHLYPLRIRDGAAKTGLHTESRRDRIIKFLQDRGIGVSVHYIPLHIMPYYKMRYNLEPEDFPEALKRFGETVSLPIWPGMTEGQIERVTAAVCGALRAV